MSNNYRVEISFKDFDQLKKRLDFCINKKIYKINIPCKGNIKKDFLVEVVKFIGVKYKHLDVIYHYSFYHQFHKNNSLSYQMFLEFLELNKLYNRGNEILLVSGSKKRDQFDVLSILENLKNFDTKDYYFYEIDDKNYSGKLHLDFYN